MSAILVLILLPVLCMLVLIFIFQSGVSQIKNQQYLVNCPSPLFVGNVTTGNPAFPNGVRFNYTVVHADVNESDNTKGKYFDCYIDTNGNPAINIIGKNYEQTVFSTINTGWYAWAGDTVYSFVSKAQPALTQVYLYIQAPAIVTSLMLFTYLNGLFFFCIGLGLFLAFRGGH